MGYGITPQETCLFYAREVKLTKKATVWPHPEELFMAGCKIQGYETLRTASFSLGFSVPFYATAEEDVQSSEFLKQLEDGKLDGVLKRDYSEEAAHVITPQTQNPAQKVRKAIQDQERTWKLVEEFFEQPRWFIQPFVSHLVYVGEVRAMIVNGRLLHYPTTRPTSNTLGVLAVRNGDLIRPINTHR